jgi:hypothetical protein
VITLELQPINIKHQTMQQMGALHRITIIQNRVNQTPASKSRVPLSRPDTVLHIPPLNELNKFSKSTGEFTSALNNYFAGALTKHTRFEFLVRRTNVTKCFTPAHLKQLYPPCCSNILQWCPSLIFLMSTMHWCSKA